MGIKIKAWTSYWRSQYFSQNLVYLVAWSDIFVTYVSSTLQLKHPALSRLKLCMRKLTALESDFLFVSHH